MGEPPRLLHTEALVCGYGEVRVTEPVGLTVQVGDRLGIVGAKGAGKSTLRRIVRH